MDYYFFFPNLGEARPARNSNEEDREGEEAMEASVSYHRSQHHYESAQGEGRDQVDFSSPCPGCRSLQSPPPHADSLGRSPASMLLQVCTITSHYLAAEHAEQNNRSVRAPSRNRVLDRARAQQWSKSRPHGPGTID